MRSSTIAETKAHFSALLADVARGGEVVVTRRGRPVARIVPALPEAQQVFDLAALRRYVEVANSQPGMTVVAMRENDLL